MTVTVSVSYQLGICRLYRSMSRPGFINSQNLNAHSFGRMLLIKLCFHRSNEAHFNNILLFMLYTAFINC